ncbi:sugar phosphate isomerase/epimerase family protein [Glutamicibacter arilaitensis]|uniref:Sugar phosphate isomerase/epimerase n=1 Tax=Glutamicibacter arilaitensis TaxID=256701 RepID=A0A4Y8TXC7_9MICC|nr:sugar phosphate isomerase/epimerase [Glutamicibacter arilaitensis]TFH56231.1 sugar phosphate isomerase/epimerase [Glutamicibacter arilaitensis]
MPAHDLSIQLYTLREHIAEDLPSTLERVADIGYTQVEPYSFVARADEYAQALAKSNLSAPTAHAPLLSSDFDEVFAAASKLGISTVIDPFIPAEHWQDAESIRATAQKLNEASRRGAEYGIKVGYHNHDWEISSKINSTTALEYFASLLDPEVVLEIDTYWVAVGGADVLQLLEALAPRVIALHIKDGPKSKNHKEQVPVGSGSMPIDQIIQATQGMLHVVELDDFAGDIFQAVSASRAYLVAEKN